MSRPSQGWAWVIGGGLAVALLAVLTARNARPDGPAVTGERPEARKAVVEQVLAASLPYHLAGLERRQMLSGAAALEAIAALHGRGLSLTGGRVARYGPAPGIVVWSGQTASAAAARQMVRDMRRGIDEADTPFELLPSSGDGVVLARGLGREHAFYASGTQVVWLEAPPAMLAQALDEIGALLPR